MSTTGPTPKDPTIRAVVDQILMPNGFAVDIDEGWRKLINRQFPDDPARGFWELVQNGIDSNPSEVPWAERRVIIETESHRIAITDFGEGMGIERLRLLCTLGGTDKAGDASKLGRFGIGFFAVFNPRLGTRRVVVVTRCGDCAVELVFTIGDPQKRPTITHRILDRLPPFSTRVTVEFSRTDSAARCLNHALDRLRYLPCPVTVNGRDAATVWAEARGENAFFFREGECDGFIRGSGWDRVTVLCKYDRIGSFDLLSLIRNSRDDRWDLRPLAEKGVPYVPNVEVVVNCNTLWLTISRDSFYLDGAFDRMVAALGVALRDYLRGELSRNPEPGLILANQYIHRAAIREYLKGSAAAGGPAAEGAGSLVGILAAAPVYRLNERAERCSLLDIHRMRNPQLPLFFSPRRRNLRWLGGAFQHEFIVLPPPCEAGHGAPDFYDDIFGCLFDGDVVNLDTIRGNSPRIAQLVQRGVVSKEALSPRCTMLNRRALTEREAELVTELDELLNDAEIRRAIQRNVRIRARRIRSVLFEVKGPNAILATGLFDEDGTPFGEERMTFSNIADAAPAEGRPEPSTLPEAIPLCLGLRREHPFVEHLVASRDPRRAYYALMFLAHELALCQKMLVPYSPFYHLVKEHLAADMRRALIARLAA